MTRLKRFKIGLFTITLGMVLVGASFALADDKAVAEGIIPPKELNETTAILAPSVAIAENEPTTQPEEWIDAVATAYCPCEICCGKWALNRPDGIVYTASGAIAEEDVTIAADWSVYSPGTILYIEGIGERTVQDRGGAISGQKIDVFFNNHEDALHFGRQEIRIKVISDTETGFGASYLARVVGQKKAREIWFLCRKYNAQEALDMGLVNKVVPLEQLEDEYVQWAEEMMLLSPLALRMIKAGLNAELDGQAGIQELAGDATLLYYLTDEAQEGKNAFLEKRKPNFKKYPKFP